MYRKYVLNISYLGTEFYGWQVQPGFRTVQGVLEELLTQIFKSNIKLRYPSRTDSGVHAIDQFAMFEAGNRFSNEQLFKILNTQLPYDVKIKRVFDPPNDNFCVQKAQKKTYLYRILLSKYNDPLRYGRVWWYPQYLDVDKLIKLKSFFVGTKDFKSFMGTGSLVKTTVRTVYDLSIESLNDEIRIFITANGFLKNMVRNIIGTMVDYARGRFTIDELNLIMERRDRTKAGFCAPPYGLYLYKVYY